MNEIRGTTVVEVGKERQPRVPGACFALFTEKDHKLVAKAEAGADGRFELRNIPPGRYRLIAKAQGLCTANIPVDVVKFRRRRVELIVYFRPVGIDVCSTGELAARTNDAQR